MSLARPEREPLDPSPLPERLVPEDVLYEAECPVVFTARSSGGQLLLAYAADDAPDGAWFIVTPLTARTLEALRRGALPLRDALTSSWMWLAHEGRDGRLDAVWAVEASELPDEHLPAPGVPLLPEHEPACTPSVPVLSRTRA